MKKLSLHIVMLISSFGSILAMDHSTKARLIDVIVAKDYITSYNYAINKRTRRTARILQATEYSPFLDLSWSDDSQQLAAAWSGPEGTIIYKEVDGKWLESVRTGHKPTVDQSYGGAPTAGHPNPTKTIAWSPDGTKIASRNLYETVIRNADSMADYLTLNSMNGKALAWSPKGNILAIAKDQEIRIFDLDSEEVKNPGWWRKLFNNPKCSLEHTLKEGKRPQSISWDPKGLQLAIGLYEGPIHLFSLSHSEVLPDTDDLKKTHVDWSSNGKLLASGSEDGTLRIWNTRTWKLITTLASSKAINSIKWRPKLNQLAATHGALLTIWNVDTKTKIEELTMGSHGTKECGDKMLALAWNNDGTKLAASNNSGLIAIWDLSGTTEARPTTIEELIKEKKKLL